MIKNIIKHAYINIPYYKKIFDSLFPNCAAILPYFWMPKYADKITDPSARTLEIYQDEVEENKDKWGFLKKYILSQPQLPKQTQGHLLQAREHVGSQYVLAVHHQPVWTKQFDWRGNVSGQ